MPKYDLKEQDLNSLSDFILALDFNRHAMRIINQKDVNDKNHYKMGD
jgi:hypothetical protein